MKKALVFYSYLPTWRIDIFNYLADIYQLKIFLTRSTEKAYSFNYNELKEQVLAEITELDYGFNFKGWAFRFGILKNLLKENPDVVFTHEYTPTTIFLALLKSLRFFHFKLVITTSDNIYMSENVGQLKRLFRHFVLNASNGMVVYSENVKLFFSKYKHLEIEVCPNIQDEKRILSNIEEVNLSEQKLKGFLSFEDDYLLFVGRLEHEKGVDILLNQFAKLEETKLKLIIVGKGSLQSALTQQAIGLGINNRLIWISELNSTSLYALYRKARLFVLPSRFEPFGAVVNEALIWGCPVLVSNIAGAIQFIVEDVNGSIININDEDDFKIKLKKWLQLTSLRHEQKNLMPYSFKQYINAFFKIGYDQN
jgi:glycosyltransferase involved in cell wall biosynthesis